MEGEFQIPAPPFLHPRRLFPFVKVTTTVSYSTGRYHFLFIGKIAVPAQPKLILFPSGETGSSQTSSSRPVIGPALEEVENPSTGVRIM